MAHPKRKHSNTRSRLRRSHDALSLKSLTTCSQCGAEVRPHRVCPVCGYYKGRQVLTIKVKESKESK